MQRTADRHFDFGASQRESPGNWSRDQKEGKWRETDYGRNTTRTRGENR